MISLYSGFDPREEAGTWAFTSSVVEHCTSPIAIMPLHLPMFRSFYPPNMRDGTNAFIYTRFLVPFLQDFRGFAIFADGADMLCKADLSELWALRREDMAVQVVKHEYKTKHPRKYVGTQMEAVNGDYPRKNWSSLMLINCEHPAWKTLTPEAVSEMSGSDLHRFRFIPEDKIGGLPVVWNWLADEFGENPEARILHWTAGTPAFPHYKDTPHAEDFRRQVARMNYVTP